MSIEKHYRTKKSIIQSFSDRQSYWRVECSGVVIVEKYTKDFEFVEGFNLETDLLKIRIMFI